MSEDRIKHAIYHLKASINRLILPYTGRSIVRGGRLVSVTQTINTRPQGHAHSRVEKMRPHCKPPHIFLIMATTPEAWEKRTTASPFKLTSLVCNDSCNKSHCCGLSRSCSQQATSWSRHPSCPQYKQSIKYCRSCWGNLSQVGCFGSQHLSVVLRPANPGCAA